MFNPTSPTLDASKSPVLNTTVWNRSPPVPGSTTGAVLVSSLIDADAPLGNYHDADGDAPGIAITGLNRYAGDWYYSTDGGARWSSVASVGDVWEGNALVLYADANTWLSFRPYPDYQGSLNDALTLQAWDRSGGHANGDNHVDIRAAAMWHLVGHFSRDASPAYGVAVSGNTTYVAAGSYGLQVLDTSDPSAPRLSATLDTGGSAWDVTVSGNTAYVTNYDGGLQVIDISIPSAPRLSATLGTSSRALDVAVSGNTAYVADYTDGLQVIDVRDPSAPRLLATLDTSGYAESVAVSGHTAYVADYASGLQVIDVSDPSAPRLLATLATSGNAEGVTVSGDTAYVADGSSGLLVIDISDPSSPKLLATVDTHGEATDVTVSGNTAYVVNTTGGLQVIDIGNPSLPSPSRLAYDRGNFMNSVAVSGDTVYLAAYDGALQIIRDWGASPFSSTSDTVSLTVSPLNEVPSGFVKLYGPAVQGQTLSVNNTLYDADGLGTISYQWLANGVAIDGATSTSYRLGEAQVGQTISVKASYIDGHGTLESVSSAARTVLAGGMLTTDFGAVDFGYAVTVQADGKILVAGTSTSSDTSSDFALARYNADGSLDRSFDADGKLTTDFGGYALGTSVSVQADGKILVAGADYTADGDVHFALARYTANGSLDRSFGADGKLTTDFSGYAAATSIVVQADGKILVGGETQTPSGNNNFALARYTANGKLDTSFDGDGKLSTDFGGDDVGSSLAVQADGKIVLAGISSDVAGHSDFALARYNANGSLDTSFDGDGKVTTDLGTAEAWSVALQTDGKIVLAGTVQDADGLSDFALRRYNSDGSLDQSFDGDGKLTTDFGASEVGYSVTIQTDGKILVAGETYDIGSNGDSDFALARYNTDGSLDTSFDGDGKLTTDLNADDPALSICVQGDGKILVAGSTSISNALLNGDFALARYNPDGSLDPTFSAYSPNAAPTGNVTISGRAAQGQTLRAANTLADLDGLGRISYQWLADGLAIGGATGATLTLGQAQVGKTISVSAAYRDQQGTAEQVTSAATATVANLNDAPIGGVTISGTPTQGQTLTAVSTLADADGLGTLNWQWLANGHAIAGATGASYTLTQAEVGTRISVQARYTDGYGTAESRTSRPSAAVANLNDAPTATDRTVSANEDTARALKAADFGFADVDAGDKLQAVRISSLPGAGTLSFKGDAVTLDQIISAADLAAGKLMFAPEIDGKGTGYAHFDYQLSDGKLWSTAAATLTIDVAPAILTGTSGKDTLTGTRGNNHLDGGAGADIMAGGAGNDSYVVDDLGDKVFETTTPTSKLDAGGLDSVEASVSFTLGNFVENLSLTGNANISATGNALANVLTGNAGDNVLDGKGGSDTLDGGDGSDIYLISAASDHPAAEIIADSGTTGSDEIRFAAAAPSTLVLSSHIHGIERVVIGTGSAAAAVATGGGAHNVDARAVGYNLTLIGNAGANTLIGTAFADSLEGGTGNDRLDGGAGADSLSGGKGRDTYVVDNAGDTISETTSAPGEIDSVEASLSWILGANLENLTLTGTGDFSATGNGLANTLKGNAGNNRLDGGAGADILIGGAGNDTYVVDHLGDKVFETTTPTGKLDAGGTDTVEASVSFTLGNFVENLTLTGTGNINATGNALANVLTGNAGDNLLDGGLGSDSLTGGLGSDTFRFDSALGAANLDTLTDFIHDLDHLQLENSVFTRLTKTGGLAEGNFRADADVTAQDANDFILYDTASGKLYYDADGNGAGVAVQFATLVGHPALSHTDFGIS